ncbi:type II secretion system protein [Mangrovibacillus cuniculi]|uniref:Type II secretion system protein n=1 Tax=Mangrovibacillus cuniculi TaxID=2593652 RepID=A0A7S8CCV2_9BACI|nr:type II secretion system protein [Mangrovibacillus cuniculi]QPC47657.1 type II secretion system protein [Mangrovibacillus cuniculi]
MDTRDESGLTLLEVLVTVIILSIVAAIAVPSVMGIIQMVREDVCEANREEVAIEYGHHLDLSGESHSDSLFTSFLLEFDVLFPENGFYSFVDGDVICSEHVSHENEEDDSGDNESVPFL